MDLHGFRRGSAFAGLDTDDDRLRLPLFLPIAARRSHVRRRNHVPRTPSVAVQRTSQLPTSDPPPTFGVMGADGWGPRSLPSRSVPGGQFRPPGADFHESGPSASGGTWAAPLAETQLVSESAHPRLGLGFGELVGSALGRLCGVSLRGRRAAVRSPERASAICADMGCSSIALSRLFGPSPQIHPRRRPTPLRVAQRSGTG